MRFLVNPRPATRKRRKATKRGRTPAQRAATRKMLAANKTRRKTKMAKRSKRARRPARTTARRSYRRNAPKRKTATKRRSKGITASAAGRRLAIRRWRGNPPVVGMLKRGVADAAAVVGGKAAANIVNGLIPNFTPATATGMTRTFFDAARALVAAGAVGMVANRMLGGDRARMVVAGALTAPIEGLIRAANVPILSGALGSYATPGYYPASTPKVRLSGAAARTGVGSYAQPDFQHAVHGL